MANQQHIAILRKGVKVWNQWRKDNLHLQPDLNGANLVGVDLRGADLRRTYLIKANLQRANLHGARISGDIVDDVHVGRTDLVQADLTDADLGETDLRRANLFKATLIRTNLSNSDLSEADLSEANLRDSNLLGADLRRAQFVNTCLENANLNGCRVFGISTWNLNLEGAKQSDLIITPQDEPTITVDNIQVAQFIYLLLTHKEIRRVIDTITSKAVLILGRFTPERKAVLDGIREKLRSRNYLPIMFDFEKPSSRDLTETITTLAGLSRFIIADLTDAKSIPQELMAIVPNHPSVAVQPIILDTEREYAMFERFTRYPWVLPLYHYTHPNQLLEALAEKVIAPAERRVMELAPPSH